MDTYLLQIYINLNINICRYLQQYATKIGETCWDTN